MPSLHSAMQVYIPDASCAVQILYSYPLDKPVSSEVASFCFPHGVNPVLLERTPSMSSLNEIIYGQRFLHSDACSFVFLMKVCLPSLCCLNNAARCCDVCRKGLCDQVP